MRFFITGAAGFTGLEVGRYLVAAGHTVYGLHRRPVQSQVLVDAGIHPVAGTLETLAEISLPAIDVVIHFAAMIGQWESSDAYNKVNVTGTIQAVEKAIAIGAKRFIHISTDMVLFEGEDCIGATEEHPLGHVTFPYASSKRQAELILQSYHSTIEIVILRPRMIWGTTANPLYKSMKAAAVSKKFLWLNNGLAVTSVTHVLNLAHAIELAATHKAAAGEIFHVADAEEHTLQSFWQQQLQTEQLQLPTASIPGWIARVIANCIEPVWHLLRIKKAPPISKIAAYSFSTSFTLNAKKIQQTLGYHPIINFDAGIAAMIKDKR
ncbi:MAG: NAD(P)-dependent oxidoreductase [Chitinophagaceae bacterium]|nr:NAD(P)-dependent oxidoreductase [Chitinophagaceae bacterium]